MTDKTGSGVRKEFRAPRVMTDAMARMAAREAADRLERRARAEVLEVRDWTGRMVFRDETERLGPPESRGPLDRAVRRANGARRVSRVLREILARLVKRANL